MLVDEPGFRLLPAWPDTMVYEEFAPGDDGAPRELRFGCRAGGEPPQVAVPSHALWTQSMPAWARSRRAVVLARLRGAGCVPWVHEPDGGWVESADGRLLVRVSAESDERSGPWEYITVWRRGASGPATKLVDFMSFGLGSTLRFGLGDTVVFNHLVDRGGRAQRIVVDGEAGTFGFHPNERPQPLRELDAWMGNRSWGPASFTPAPAPSSPARRLARTFGQAILLAGGMVLSAGGAWMAMAADTPHDRWVGVFGCLFFGACIAAELSNLLKRRRAAAVAPPPPARSPRAPCR